MTEARIQSSDSVVAHDVGCWVCDSRSLRLVKGSDLDDKLQARDFAISDDRYGKTANIYRCSQCGFMQCHDVPEVLQFYAELEDPAYEEGRGPRALQAQRLLRSVLQCWRGGRNGLSLLDIGAGTGILVEAASGIGLQASGIEPSAWLTAAARSHGCDVKQGTLPHPEIAGPYDLVTMIDVIEHVRHPLALLQTAKSVLAKDGLLAIVTPDCSSLAASVLGWHWWHYRVAHIGYFNRATITRLCQRTGLRVVAVKRPGWFFTISYIHQRLHQYLPAWMLGKPTAWMQRVVVPLNLRDSLLIICRNA